LKINDLRNTPLSVAPLPKLDVVGSSPIARSLEIIDRQLFKVCLVRNGDQALFVVTVVACCFEFLGKLGPRAACSD
jgi:hypothetical protein